ncbi:MAG: flavodoxin family protein [Actinomycetota bacterium]|nr:flavodoxin family protein [Actinomycetota bacterium]
MKIVVVVASATGRTRRMAEALVEGAESEGAEVLLLDASEADGEAIADAHALVLGCGVHMAGVPTPMRSFLERLAPQWMAGDFAGKLGAGFVTAGAGARGGGEMALVELLSSLAQHGMLIVSMPSRTDGFSAAGSHWGPIAWTNPRSGEAGPTPGHLKAARAHGAHVARCAARWGRGGAADRS